MGVWLGALTLISFLGSAQSVSFKVKTSPNIAFDFNSVADYQNGITFMNAFTLNIEAVGTQWDLYVGATSVDMVGMMDVVTPYSTVGVLPPVSLVQLRFRNGSNTSLQSGFFHLTDRAAPTYIIGSTTAPDAPITCPNSGTNTAGDYLSNSTCYTFGVDLKIVPGFTYRPGLYRIRIDYIIAQDL